MPQAFVTLFCEAIKAVLRTLSGVRFCSPGKRSATGGDIPHTAKNPAPFGTGFFLNAKTKIPVFRPGKRSATGETCRHAGRTTETQKAHPAGWALHLFDAWQFPTLTWGDPTLPSALRRFTSEFGMGSGGTTALVPPGKFFVLSTQFFILRTQL
jgi:hypothetical protein